MYNNKTKSDIMTTNNIKDALQIMETYNWWWSLGNNYAYTDGTRDKMQNKMRKFVALSANCTKDVCNALRTLWKETYDFAHKDWMFSSSTPQDKAEYEEKKAKLMQIILPSMAVVA